MTVERQCIVLFVWLGMYIDVTINYELIVTKYMTRTIDRHTNILKCILKCILCVSSLLNTLPVATNSGPYVAVSVVF